MGIMGTAESQITSIAAELTLDQRMARLEAKNAGLL
jgi:hypothetical protein